MKEESEKRRLEKELEEIDDYEEKRFERKKQRQKRAFDLMERMGKTITVDKDIKDAEENERIRKYNELENKQHHTPFFFSLIFLWLSLVDFKSNVLRNIFLIINHLYLIAVLTGN